MAAFLPLSLAGQSILIFGGSSGIGFQISRQCALGGAKTITLIGTTEAKLQEAKSKLKNCNETAACEVHTVCLDMTGEEAMEAFFSALPEKSVDHMVVTAGRSVYNGNMIVNKRKVSDLRKQMEAKFYIQMNVVLLGHERMVDGGSFVLFSGILSQRPGHGNMSLSVANAAVEASIKGLANDLGKARGIRINCVSPGMTRTDVYLAIPEDKRGPFLEASRLKTPLARIGEPEEVAMSALYLMVNRNVTGQTLVNDAGLSI